LKLLYLVIDGMGDLPTEELGKKTPLEAAETPNMDLLAKMGKLGLMYTIGKGIAPESDAAVISILGYDPHKYYTGRGPLEAVGAGLNMKDGDLALRCNFATLGDGRRIIDRRAGRDLTEEEASKLSEAINEQVRLESYPAYFEFKNTISHRGVLVIKSRDRPLSAQITNTDPAYDKIEGISVAKKTVDMILDTCEPIDNTPEAKVSADLVNEFTKKSHLVLDEHEVNRKRTTAGKLKANLILSRSPANRLPRLFNINEKYGVQFACLLDMPVERGICRLAGISTIPLPPPSGDLKHDSVIRAKGLLEAASFYDCFYIHIKGPDEPGHDGDPQLKKHLIEIIDEHFLGSVLPHIKIDEWIICVTADHSTPCKFKTHSDDPVPLLISGDSVSGDGIEKFGERECRKGSLGVLEKGSDLMPRLMNLLKR